MICLPPAVWRGPELERHSRMAKKPANTISLRIELLEVEPLVWRRVRVADTITLKALHRVLQTVMGWDNSHLHEYRLGDTRIGMIDVDSNDESSEPLEDEKAWTLRAVMKTDAAEFEYDYDFADGWRHRVVIEPNRAALSNISPLCVAGENACPPEDVGGPHGYQAFQQALANPQHPGHEGTVDWIGGIWDPKGFDLNHVNRMLRGRGGGR